MARDVQILIAVLAILAGIGIYVVTDGEDMVVARGQSAVAFGPSEPPAPALAAPAPEPAPAPTSSGGTGGGRCVEMRFYDEKGIVLPVDPPIIGIQVGEGPLFEGKPPQFTSFQGTNIVPCPPQLVASVLKSFTDLCTSEERRKKSAAENGVDIAFVNKRCGDLSAALSK